MTLYVLAAGVSLAILFDAAFNYLRRTLLVYASARIDVRTSTRTFERLLSLSIDFFERVSAGVITKHMQQVEKIREFLTGRACDASARLLCLHSLRHRCPYSR